MSELNAVLPSVGSVVSRDMTHAITGRRGTLNQLLAVATTKGRPRGEIERPSHIHTAPNTHQQSTKASTFSHLKFYNSIFSTGQMFTPSNQTFRTLISGLIIINCTLFHYS